MSSVLCQLFLRERTRHEFLHWCCINMCSNCCHHCVKVSDKHRFYHVNTLLYCDQCLPYLHFQFHNHPGYYTSAQFELPPFCLLYICQIKLASDYSMSILLSCHTLSCPDYSLSALFMLSSPELSWLLPIGPFMLSSPELSWLLHVVGKTDG